MGVQFDRAGRGYATPWDFVSTLLGHLEAVPTHARLATALCEITGELFGLSHIALCWRPVHHRHYRELSLPGGLPLEPSLVESLSLKPAALPYAHLHVRTATELELYFFYLPPADGEVDQTQLELALRLWSLRLEKALCEQEKAATALQLARIRTVTDELSKGSDYQTLLSRVLRMTLSLVDASQGLVMILDEHSKELRTEVFHGEADKIAQHEQGIQERVMRTRQPVLIEHITDHNGLGADPLAHSIICVPLVKQDEAFGLIYVSNKKENVRFAPQDLDLVCILASTVASVVDQMRLFHQSITDYLTGLYQRRHLEPRLEHEVRRSLRYGTPFSLLAMDADHFKRINDTYGHQAGDQALKAIAHVIRSNVRTHVDLPARMGGEEFAVLLPETDEAGALKLGERIRAQMERTELCLGGQKERLTLSLGIATCPANARSVEELLSMADQALYASKQQGRNRVSAYSRITP